MVRNKNLGHYISQVLALVFEGEGQKCISCRYLLKWQPARPRLKASKRDLCWMERQGRSRLLVFYLAPQTAGVFALLLLIAVVMMHDQILSADWDFKFQNINYSFNDRCPIEPWTFWMQAYCACSWSRPLNTFVTDQVETIRGSRRPPPCSLATCLPKSLPCQARVKHKQTWCQLRVDCCGLFFSFIL